MCSHLFVRTDGWESACTLCGQVFRDPPASEPFVGPRATAPNSVDRAVRRVGSVLDATSTVCSTAADLVVHIGSRSSNINAIAAAMYVAFRIHRLDRLEDEIVSRVPGVTARLFAKYVNKIRRHGLDPDRRDVDTSAVFRRVLSTTDDSRRNVAKRVRLAESAYTQLYRVYADRYTVPVLIRMALATHHHDHEQHHDETA